MSLLRHGRVIVPAFLALLAAPGMAQEVTNTVIYYRVGQWDAFSGTATNGGTFCGIETGNAQDGRGLMIRFRTGGNTLVFRAHKPGWTIPAGTSIPVTMQFGPNPAWTATGTGERDVVEWSIPKDSMPTFDTQFRAGVAFSVGFPSGNEAPWTISLAGSNAAGLTLTRCIRELSAQAAPTQPFASNSQASASANVTQPFSGAPETSAPPSPAAPPSLAAPTQPATPAR